MSYNDTQHIRHLLDRFYQGLTSPEEEAALSEYFAGNPDPALSADAAVFRSLNALQDFQSPEPADLEQRLRASLPPRQKASGGFSFGIISWITGAVAAVLVFGLFIYKSTYSHQTITRHAHIIGVCEVKITSHSGHHADSGSELQPEEETPSTPAGAASLNRVSHSVSEDNLPYCHEVTDPEEAARIILQVNTLLASNLTHTGDAMMLADATIESSINKYNSITQKLSE